MACSRCGARNRVVLTQMIDTVGSSLPYLKFLQCAYQDQFESLFAQKGIKANENNLVLIAKLFDNGGDLRGDFNPNGTPIKFSVQEIIDKIDTSKPVKNNCSIDGK